MKYNNPILLIEDDIIDAMTVKRALKELKVSNPVIRVENGEKAIAYLKDKNNVRPTIILLDLNMPKMNGLEFLKIVKADPRFNFIPVIVLTTSGDEKDKIETFKHSIAGYMIKPVDYNQFVETIRTIERYWTLSELPIKEDGV